MTFSLIVNRDGSIRLADREGDPPKDGFISHEGRKYFRLPRKLFEGVPKPDLIDVYEEATKKFGIR